MRPVKYPLLVGAIAGTATLAACSSPPAPPISFPSTPSQSVSSVDPATAGPTSPAASGSGVHHITLTQDDGNGVSYRIDMDVTLGTPALDSADANPGTTDISIPMTLDSGTLTNTSSGGLEDSPDGMPEAFYIGPSLPARSFTCTVSQSDGQWPKVENLAPYAGCGVMGDILVENSDADSNASGILPAGQSEPLDLLTGAGMFSNPNVNVPTPDAQKVAAELASGDVCLVITGFNTGSEGSIEGKPLEAGACG
jgi:hypothetical protein